MRRAKVLGLLGLPLVGIAILVAVLSFSLGSTDKASADAPHAGLDTQLGIGSCLSDPSGAVKCTAAEGATFQADVILNSAGGASPYAGFDSVLNYSGVTAKGTFTIMMTGCAFPAANFATPGVAAVGCATADPPIGSGPTTYTGVLARINFNCTADGSITLAYGPGNTGLTTPDSAFHSEGSPPTGETLDVNCVPATSTPTQTPTPTPPPVPRMQKLAKPGNTSNLANLFLTRTGSKIPPANCRENTPANGVVFNEVLSTGITTLDPKNGEVQKLGAFEWEVHYDEDKVCVMIDPADLGPNWICFVEDDSNIFVTLEGIARVGCVSQGKTDAVSVTAPGFILGTVTVVPQPDTFSQLRPNQENLVAVQINDIGCELADDQGHPIPIFSCEDADVSIRFLEGDVAGPDCAVDVIDAQNQAVRWGAAKGSALYNSFFDLEPSGQVKGDGDIDIKDLQFVFGRFGSTCAAPHPPQPPVNPKA